ncbi:hypothetical protein HK100_004610 [Physocladia obscura]|uniref:Fungal lipase-type domain-containing protein n=1 Tax=Physocladia obscura TaxID=109957 RepID=A0AAD5XCH3_9FUNG|nr:hypothetical protein HK100_004610 [Physocladia obscura]
MNGSIRQINNTTTNVPQFLIDKIKISILPYAQSAFCPFNEIEKWNCTTCISDSEGTTEVSTFGGTPFAASGYTAANLNSKKLIVAFRGTSSFDTWISDLLIAKPDYDLPAAPPGTKVHYGFLSLWQAVRDEVIQNVENLLGKHGTKNINILFTGHSLGGALATIAAADIFQHLQDRIDSSQITLITFGQPRVGNPQFASWVNSLNFTHTFRVTNQDDWTPHLPPLFSGFKHFHQDLWIANKEGDTIQCWDDGGDESRGYGDENPATCKDRLRWKYDVRKHSSVWGEQIGFQACIPIPI